jgi:hypothetical protein
MNERRPKKPRARVLQLQFIYGNAQRIRNQSYRIFVSNWHHQNAIELLGRFLAAAVLIFPEGSNNMLKFSKLECIRIVYRLVRPLRDWAISSGTR